MARATRRFSSQSQYGETSFQYNLKRTQTSEWSAPATYTVTLAERILLYDMKNDAFTQTTTDISFMTNLAGKRVYWALWEEDWYPRLDPARATVTSSCRRGLDQATIGDGEARVAVFVDQALGRPGQRVLEDIVRMLWQRADTQFHGTKFVEMRDHFIGRDGYEAGREAALGTKAVFAPSAMARTLRVTSTSSVRSK